MPGTYRTFYHCRHHCICSCPLSKFLHTFPPSSNFIISPLPTESVLQYLNLAAQTSCWAKSSQFNSVVYRCLYIYIYERHCRVKDTVFSALVLCALHARQGGSHTPEKLQGTTNKALLLTCTDQNNHAVDQT